MFLHVRVGSSHYAYAHVFALSVRPRLPTMAEAQQQAPYTAAVPGCEAPFPSEEAVPSAIGNDVNGAGTSGERHPGADDRKIGQLPEIEEEEEEEEEEDEEDFAGWWVLAWARRPNKDGVTPEKNEDGTALLLTRVPNDGSGVKQYEVRHFNGRKASRPQTVETVMDQYARLVGEGQLAMSWNQNQYNDPAIHLTKGTKFVVADVEYDDIHLKETTDDTGGGTTSKRQSYWVFADKPRMANPRDEWLELFKPGNDIDSETNAESSTTPVRAGKYGGGKGGRGGNRNGPYATGWTAWSWNAKDEWDAKSQWGQTAEWDAGAHA